MPPQKSEFDKEMAYLEAEIRRLEAEFNMFFAGRLPRPPWETRAKVAALVKKHDQSFIRNTADRFRFETLQNKHAKFLELWERQMNNRELGRPVPGARRMEPPPVARRADPEDAPKREPGSVVRFGTDSDPSAETNRVQELYERLAAAKKEVGEAPIALDRLQALVKAQVQKFGADGSKVAFRIDTKDGKVSLTVKPEKD
ncbi:MAG TPA: hypothetical protein VF491_12820 [Vicinamibacterales bacterium]